MGANQLALWPQRRHARPPAEQCYGCGTHTHGVQARAGL